MGRRRSYSSDFEQWRSTYLAGVADAYGDTFAAEVEIELADEVDCFGTGPGDPPDNPYSFLAMISEARALVRRRTG